MFSIVMYYDCFHSARLYIFLGKALVDCRVLKTTYGMIKEISMGILL